MNISLTIKKSIKDVDAWLESVMKRIYYYKFQNKNSIL